MLPKTDLSRNDFAGNLISTILVVEDEDLIRMFMTEFLQDFGYHVREAANVQQAKQVMLDQAVDLVFSDINMPGEETGFALEKWLRRHFPDTKVLLTSGFPHPASDTRDLREPLILKPYNSMSVIRRIQALLAGAKVREPVAAAPW